MKVRLTYRMDGETESGSKVVEASDTCTAIIDFIAETFPRGVRPVRVKAEVVRETDT